MTSFKDQVIDALIDHVEPWVDLPVFSDRDESEGGDFYDKKFAHALCRSICMVVIYSPTYFDETNNYCTREYYGMEQIEKIRMGKIQDPILKQKGHIIPIIYRGRLPDQIAQKRDYKYDFSNFLLRSDDVSLHEKYAKWFDQIGKRIHQIRIGFEREGLDPVDGLDDFKLPSPAEITPFFSAVLPRFHFPGRLASLTTSEVGYGL